MHARQTASSARPMLGLGYAKAFLAVLLWGGSFIALRIALHDATPVGAVWMRNALGAAFLFALLRARKQPLLPGVQDRPRVFFLGLLLGVHFLIQTWALEHTTTMRAGWIIAFIPAMVALGAWAFLRERMRLLGWAGLVIASTGVFLLTALHPANILHVASGDLWMLSSTLTWAAYTLVSLGPASRNGGLRVSANALLIAAIPAFFLGLYTGTWRTAPTPSALVAVAYLGIGASGLAMWFFSDAVVLLGAQRSSAMQFIQPFVTVISAWLILSESIGAEQWIGGPVVLLGVWLVQRARSTTAQLVPDVAHKTERR